MAVGGGLRKNKRLTCGSLSETGGKAGNGFGHVRSLLHSVTTEA